MNDTPETDGFSIGILAAGNADWLSKVVAPLQGELLTVIPRHFGEIPPPLRQRMTRSEPPIMNFWGQLLTVGVILYVPVSKLLGKALDEGYDVILKPRIRKVWQGLEKRLIGGNQRNKKAFLCSVWYEELNVLVTVAVVGATLDEIVEQLDAMRQVHMDALTRIATVGVAAPVHYYRLQDGKVNAEPQLFERGEDVLKHLVSGGIE